MSTESILRAHDEDRKRELQSFIRDLRKVAEVVHSGVGR